MAILLYKDQSKNKLRIMTFKYICCLTSSGTREMPEHEAVHEVDITVAN